jgi:capsular polysaccharide biosynthesis protein
MSQQPLDLRRSIQIVRRRKKLFGAVVVLGLLVGAAYGVLKPPLPQSTALVLLPQASAQDTQSTSTDTLIQTEVVVAGSDSVLTGALAHVSPAMSLQTLRNTVQVGSEAGSILSFTASGKTATEAEDTANAVANSYVAYVSAANSPAGHVQAQVLEPAITATGTKGTEHTVIYALLGLLAGALVGFVIVLAVGRQDRRLLERDAIANSIGAPVLASIPVAHPSDPLSWAKLLDEYEQEVVHRWALTRLLQGFGLPDGEALAGTHNGARPRGFSLTVLSLSSDPGALALGPQLATFAAALGVPTALVIGPQQDVNVTATLRTACAAAPHSAERRKPLQLVVSDAGDLGQLRAAFVVVVAVVDGGDPRMPDGLRTTGTVLAVSAGAATAEQLARAATAAAASDREIFGILVADPEPGDQTTGRIPRLAAPAWRSRPTRVSDIPTEIRR